MEYIYTATFTVNEGKYYARVPDLPGCITTGRSLEEAIDMITDAANGWLVVAEDEGLSIPEPTSQKYIPQEPDAVYSLIRCDTIKYRAETDTKAVRKNVSLPAWMVNLADKRGINCSQVLQEALRIKLSSSGSNLSL
jgi:predicted RNase H-like HicB family nuclease